MFNLFKGNKEDGGIVFLEIMVAVVMMIGTIFVMAYKGVDKITKWGITKHRDRKERERISKL